MAIRSCFYTCLLALLVATPAYAQQSGVWLVDVVDIKAGKQPEALFYYENNWKVIRDRMIQRKHLKSYRMLTTATDSTGSSRLFLMTEYADSLSYRQGEERFQAVIKELYPNGSRLLNELKPADFRQIIAGGTARTLFSSDGPQRPPK
ncbi:MAG: hypothetical protein H7Z72_00725 [Bacteroidetes bacterium]|nr:hypothetical protein [Fibrella sp.]